MADLTANPIVTALASGRPEAYAALYERVSRPMMKVATVMLGHSQGAEDAVQDVFLELVRHREVLHRVRDLDSYLFAMLRHAVGRRLARERQERQKLQNSPSHTTAKSAEFLPDELNGALQSLPPDQREVIALKIDGELTFAQIGEVLRISPNTAASRYRYALEKLRRKLE